MTKILECINSFVWGIPALVLILGVGVFLTLRTGFVQLRLFPRSVGLFFSRLRGGKQEDGTVTSFQALCTALAATVGTGNLAGVAGAIYGVTKIWAGFADLIAGNVVDKTNSRWGRLRPYLLFGPAPLAVFFVALFSTPAGLNEVAAIAWIFIFDALFQLAYSFVNIPYGSLASAMTQDPVDRSKLSGSRAIASSLASVALAWVVAPQFEDTQGDGIRLQFMITCIVLAVVKPSLRLASCCRLAVVKGAAGYFLRSERLMRVLRSTSYKPAARFSLTGVRP